jgi:plastocyanin domain-containing protein
MKRIAITILLVGVSLGLIIVFFGGRGRTNNNTSQAKDNVTVVEGKQIITISARGGYYPNNSVAKADMPTILRVETNGTFDCSSALNIPNLGYRGNLPQSGTTDIEIPPQKAGATIRGLCAMGMYNFVLNFN